MRRVVDSCAGFKWLVAEPDSDKAIRLRDDYVSGAVELLAPDIFPIEIAHALTRAERQGRITRGEGFRRLSDMVAALPIMHPTLPLLPRAYEISSLARVGVYDCLYVALAEREGCEMITADDRLIRGLGTTFPFLMALSATP